MDHFIRYQLTYQNTILKERQWMVFLEFSLEEEIDWFLTDNEIIDLLIGTRIYDESLNHSGFDKVKLEVCLDGVFRPFEFKELKSSDFSYLKSRVDFLNKLTDLENEDDWETDILEYKELKIETIRDVDKQTDLKNGLWFIRKNDFEETDPRLAFGNHIYKYYLSFIEIDRTNQKVRTIELGYD